MVSALWKACEDGDIIKVHELLKEASSVDIEVKDHSGATPLIVAVKGGHLEVVRALLAKGADIFNDSSQGSPDAHTNDPAIRQLLDEARSRVLTQTQTQTNPQPAYPSDSYPVVGSDPKYGYYPQPYFVHSPYAPYGYMPAPPNGAMPPAPYPFYAPMPPPPPAPAPEHPPHQQELTPQSPFSPQSVDAPITPNHPHNVDTKNIPCRFYPSCKYGASCHYAHPQAPFQPGPLPPPAEYPPASDGVNPAMNPIYYPPPHPSYSVAHGPSVQQTAVPHSRPQSEVTSPVVGPYMSNGHPGAMYGPVMHPPYPNGAPYGMPPPPPPGYMQNPQMGCYPPTSPVASVHPYHSRRESVSRYSQGVVSPLHALDPTHLPRSPPMEPGMELQNQPQLVPRDSQMHVRRNSMQRRPPPMLGKRPPCMFFPSGRCRNGNDCRYPHILNDGSTEVNPVPRPPRQSAGFGQFEERMGNLHIRDNHSPKQNGINGFHGPMNGHARDQRFPNGKPVPMINGIRRNNNPVPQQRLPTEEDFPVLQGSAKGSPSTGTPPTIGGLTAAQVLQAPPPKRESLMQNGKAEHSPTSPVANGDLNGVHSPGSPPEVAVSA